MPKCQSVVTPIIARPVSSWSPDPGPRIPVLNLPAKHREELRNSSDIRCTGCPQRGKEGRRPSERSLSRPGLPVQFQSMFWKLSDIVFL